MSNTNLSELLASNYMLVDATISSWSGNATDRSASNEILTQKNAAADGGKFIKKLLASADAELKEVHTLGNAIRTYIYNRTVPWSSSAGSKRGERVLATVEAMNFLSGLASLKKDRDNAVLKLQSVWNQRVAEAMQALGGLANPDDYIAASQIPGLFAVTVDLKPIPAITDFTRLNVPAELAGALSSRYESMAEVRIKNAMDDMRQRLMDELVRMEKQLAKHGAGEKTRLYDSLVTNLQAWVGMAKTMNLTGSTALDELIAKIELKLLTHPVAVLRDNTALATAVAADAKQLAVEAAEEAIWS